MVALVDAPLTRTRITPPQARAVTTSQCDACPARQVPGICGAASERSIERLAALAERVELKQGESAARQEEAASHAIVLAEGRLRLSTCFADGARHVGGFAVPGDVLALAGDQHGQDAEALEPVRACRFERRRLHALLDEHPELQRGALVHLLADQERGRKLASIVARRSARARVAWFVLSEARRIGLRTVRLPTLADMADHLGITTETVCRVLSGLVREGLLKTDRRQTTILDIAALEAEV